MALVWKARAVVMWATVWLSALLRIPALPACP
jgi:hypothetical protein